MKPKKANDSRPAFVVVFSTYQSLESVSKAQKSGLPSST